MPDSPMFSKIDADRVLKRAAEIEGSEDSNPITVAELRYIAGEAGFGSQAVERAISEARWAASMEVRHHPVGKTGIVITRLSTVRSVPFELSSEQLMRAIRLFQPYREGPAQVKLGEDRVNWRDRKGLLFAVTSAAGTTEIRVYVSKILFRRGRWMGWVKSAADRLEALLFLVDAQGPSGSRDLGPPVLGSGARADGVGAG